MKFVSKKTILLPPVAVLLSSRLTQGENGSGDLYWGSLFFQMLISISIAMMLYGLIVHPDSDDFFKAFSAL